MILQVWSFFLRLKYLFRLSSGSPVSSNALTKTNAGRTNIEFLDLGMPGGLSSVGREEEESRHRGHDFETVSLERLV